MAQGRLDAAHLAALRLTAHDADTELPSVLDVTAVDAADVEAVSHLPVVTVRAVDTPLPPPAAEGADLCIPREMLPTVRTAVARNPIASLTLARLVTATHTLPVRDALALESSAYSMLQSGAEYAAWLATRSPGPAPEPGARVAVSTDGDGTRVTLTRAARANALDTRARHELVEALHAAAAADGPISLHGDGPHFCAGGDLDEFGLPEDPTRSHVVRLRQAVPATVASVADRLTAHVHGAVIGAGLELSAFAARVLARPEARFRLPEVRMGLLPGSGGTVSIPRRIGPNRALALMLTGSVLSAEQALTWGLIDGIEEG